MKFTSHDSPLTTHRASALRSAGFTVVELAVVLVVIGLIFVGVLKLEQVYRNYRIKQVINQAREISAVLKVYRDKFGYWPGDDPYANVHVGAANVGSSPNVGNDQINQFDVSPASPEYVYLFEHIIRAGLIRGAIPTFYAPGLTPTSITHAFKGDVWILYCNTSNGFNRAGNGIRFDNLPYDVAQALDLAIDDGNYRTGNVRSRNEYSASAWELPPAKQTTCFLE